MKIIAGMATTNERLEFAERSIESIIKQVDQLHLYNNSLNKDIADNGKYNGLTKHEEPIYYLTLDDDIIYPKGYVDNMLEQIEKHKCIVSHHGRELLGLSDKHEYYTGHKAYAFYSANNKEIQLDVFGDGVAAYRTDYFNPVDMVNEDRLRMADTIVSLKMWEQGKKAILLKHGDNEIRPQRVPKQLTITGTRHTRYKEKHKIVDEIWLIKNKS